MLFSLLFISTASASVQYTVENESKLGVFRHGSAVLFEKHEQGAYQPLFGFCKGGFNDLSSFPAISDLHDLDELFLDACAGLSSARRMLWRRTWRRSSIFVDNLRASESGVFAMDKIRCGALETSWVSSMEFRADAEISDILAMIDLRPFCHLIFDLLRVTTQQISLSLSTREEFSCALVSRRWAVLAVQPDENGNFEKIPYVNNLILKCPGTANTETLDFFLLPPGERRNLLFKRLLRGERQSQISQVCAELPRMAFADLCSDGILPSWISGIAPASDHFFML